MQHLAWTPTATPEDTLASSNDGNRVDDDSAILGAIGNGALSQCSAVERENNEEDEFPDAEPKDEENVDPEDRSDGEGDSALEDKDEASELGCDALARFPNSTSFQSETSVDTCVEAASQPPPDICNLSRSSHAAPLRDR